MSNQPQVSNETPKTASTEIKPNANPQQNQGDGKSGTEKPAQQNQGDKPATEKPAQQK